MNHAEYLVDLVDENGTIVGSKPRREINKSTDLYHTVFVILRTRGNELILSKIPERKDLPNIYPGSIGATAATIRRHNETPGQASIRAVKNELYIEDAQLTHLSDGYAVLPDGRENYMSVYRGTHSAPEEFSHIDIGSFVTFGQVELDDALRSNRGQFAPTFLAIWQKCQKGLFSV
jgi:hypothetical protein